VSDRFRIVGYSFLILFLELALIRYVPSSVRLVGYYTNFVLISAFLGMGVGLLLEKRGNHYPYLFPFALLVLLLLVEYFSNVVVERASDPNEYLWLIVLESSPRVNTYGIYPVLAVHFLATSLCFVPLAMGLGKAFRKFPPLTAYTLDIAGSLTGIVAFFILSHFSFHPKWWFLAATGLFLMLAHARLSKSMVSFLGVCACLVVLFQGSGDRNEVWSPYYRIDYSPRKIATVVNVNGSLHQVVFDFREESRGRSKYVQGVFEDFQKPYRYIDGYRDVLIVGAGTGNDVVFALMNGAEHIDAVEIDQELIALGRRLNPHKPYENPKVNVIVDDARAYFKKSEKRYDLIVFGTLDSQALLSGMTSLRLDNYVYTRNAFLSARELLRPGGAVIVHHMSPSKEIAAKIYQMLQDAFEEEPVVFFVPDHRTFNYTFLIGAGDVPLHDAEEAQTLKTIRVDLPSDDWPYLYLKEHVIPSHYLKAFGILLGIGFLLLLLSGGGGLLKDRDVPMFLLGAGFLLLETKSVTQMSLLFASTWRVNVLVFMAILTMIFAANVITMRIRRDYREALFALLFVALGVNYLLPVEGLLALPLIAQWTLGSLLVASPIFAAGLLFATLFKNTQDSLVSLGYNFLGAVCGGFLENTVMWIGIQNLHLIILLIYVGAFVAARRSRSGTVV
jgi:hypothetical protein